MNLALFDFDGTITANDNYTAFIRYASKDRLLIRGFLFITPISLAYRLGLLSGPSARKAVSFFSFRGLKESVLLETGRHYAEEIIPPNVREVALQRMQWHREQGDHIVVVSASLDFYLRHWCERNGLAVLCTGFEVRDGIVTGRYLNGDCTGVNKAKHVLGKYNLSGYQTVYAYGDTTEDRELLGLASKKYFRWKEVEHVPEKSSDCDTSKTIDL
jgi:HAD superfamily hydrolase (TIGR01490 family)